ncbi:MAG: hypothetical protein ACRCX4_06915, partial [Bacteroidales bacterium]
RERQLQLLRIDATQPVKPLWFKMTTLNANSLLLTKEVNDKQTALQILTDQSVANALQLKQAEEERTRLRRFSEALQPQLKEARRLDNQLLFVRNERTRLETLLKEQEQRISFMHQNQLTLQKEIEALHISQSRINDWINQHKVFEKMIPAVPALLIQLEAYAKGKAEIDPVRLESKRLTTDSIQLEESSIARKQQLDVLFTQIETLRKELVLKQTLLEQANPHILRTQSEELAAQLRALTEWAAYTSQERSYAESLRINTTALNDTSLECQKAASELHTQTLQLSELETRLEEAEQAHRLTLSMANHSVESLRDNLEKDKPCPVCGALDHPFSDRNTITRIVGELEKHYQDILAQTQSARQLLTTQTAALAALEQSLTKLTTEKEFLARQTEENKQHVSQLTDAFPFLADLATGSYKLIYSQILAKSEEIKKQLDEAAQIELSVNLLRKEQITKEDHLREQQKLYDQLRNQTEENKKNASEMTMRYQTLKESLTERYLQLRDQLNPFYKEEQWSIAPADFVHTLTDLYARWNQQAHSRDELTKQKDDHEAKLALLAKEQEGFERENAETIKQLHELTRQLTELITQRAAFFEGALADEVEAKAAKELNEVSNYYEGLFARKLEFEKTCVALESEIKSKKQQIEQALLESDQLKQSVLDWLTDYAAHTQHNPLVWDDLEMLFALSDEVIIRDRNFLQSLREKEIAIQTRLSSLQKSIETHRTLPAQIEGADSARLTQDIQEVENKLNAEKQQLIESQLTLRNHSLNLTKRAYIATEIEKSRQIAGEWSKLNEAFGAQNGDKFRKIAMSFTLDLLLSHANHYLRLINDR